MEHSDVDEIQPRDEKSQQKSVIRHCLHGQVNATRGRTLCLSYKDSNGHCIAHKTNKTYDREDQKTNQKAGPFYSMVKVAFLRGVF